MKSIRFVLFIALLQIAGNIDAQTEYYAGTSQISIEPDQALLSLHLGGYGLPRNGRFTLQWTSLGSLPEAVSLAVSGNNMYIISNNELLRLVPENQSWKWEKAGPAEGIISVAGAEGKMY